jgi:myosin-15
LYGIKDGKYGLFPSDFVERMSPQAIRREMRVITNVTRSSYKDHYQSQNEANNNTNNNNNNTNNNGHHSPLDTDYEEQGNTWDSNRLLPKPPGGGADDDGLSEVSASAANVANDGKHPLLEFAMRYFREGKDKFEHVMSDNENGSLGKKKAKKKKSGASDSDWTWKDRVDMVKWTDRMINNSLLRLEPSELNKMALECFACIMRYMGDLGLLKNQHEVDCVNTILMYCHKFEPLRDEVYCQIMRQTTNNKSAAPVIL